MDTGSGGNKEEAAPLGATSVKSWLGRRSAFDLLDCAKQVESEEHCLIVLVGAIDLCLAYDTTLDEVHDTDHLAELTLQVVTIVLICDKEYVTLALVDCLLKCLDINVM